MPTDGIKEENWIQFPHMDKVVHLLMYGILTFLILRKNHVLFGKSREINVLAFSFLYAFFMGFFIEILQNSFFIGRNFDIFDVIANSIGSILAIFGFRIYNHLNK